MPKPNKIKLRLTGGRKALTEFKPYIDRFTAHRDFKETFSKLKRRGNTPLLELTIELTETM